MAQYMNRLSLGFIMKTMKLTYKCLATGSVSGIGSVESLGIAMGLSVRYYSPRTWYRRPVKVLMPNEDHTPAEQLETSPLNVTNLHPTQKQFEPPLPTKTPLREVHRPYTEPKDPIIPHYIKLKENTHLFVSVVTLAKSRKQREKKGKILLEGRRLIQDALEADIRLDSLFFTQEENLIGLDLSSIPNLKLYKVTYKDMSIWSDMTTSPGLMAVFDRPNYEMTNIATDSNLRLTIICDNIREPGNLGAVLRCAAAVGCKRVLLTKGCVDLWEPKVLRAGCGAHFRTVILNNIQWEFMGNYISDTSKVYLASNDPSSQPRAISSEDLPSSPGRRTWYEVAEDGKILDPTFIDKRKLKNIGHLPTKAVAYFGAQFSNNQRNIVLIVGGETEGVSDAAHKFTTDMDGQLVFIPLENGIESLNSAVAMGIIVFEIQRQLCTVAPDRQSGHKASLVQP